MNEKKARAWGSLAAGSFHEEIREQIQMRQRLWKRKREAAIQLLKFRFRMLSRVAEIRCIWCRDILAVLLTLLLVTILPMSFLAPRAAIASTLTALAFLRQFLTCLEPETYLFTSRVAARFVQH